MDQERIKHLEFIQNVITRMNRNSFQIKSLTITILSAFLAIYASNKNIIFIYIGIIPTLIFWSLDAFYLQQERKFRGVYNDVADIKNNVNVQPFEMPIKKYKGGCFNYFNAFTSNTIFGFYFPIIILLILSGIILCYIK